MTKSISDQAEEALRAVAESPLIAFDVETSGVDWKRNVVVGYVITVDKDANWYVPIRHGGGGNLGDAEPIREVAIARPMPVHYFEVALAKAFSERNRLGLKTVGHNIKFDAHFAANHGVMLGRNINCTQINEALINEHLGAYSLSACCKRHGVTEKLGDELYAAMAGMFGGEPDRNQMKHFWRMPGDDRLVMEYAMGDGVSTLELYRSQMGKINEEDQYGNDLKMVHQLESDLIWTVFRMERIGIKIDVDRIQEVKEELARMEAEARKALPDGFNVRSTAQVKDWLEKQGVTQFPRTEPTAKFPDGQVSIRQGWLESQEIGKPIVAVRKIQDLSSKFITPLEERHIFEGRVHATLYQLPSDDYGTIGGRFSCAEPNLQQLSSRDKVLGRLLRSVFIPDGDMEFIESDMSQAEPRLFSHFTGSEMLLKGYNSKPFVDMHSVMSGRLGIERDLAKRVNMALLTGQSLGGFARHMEWPMDRAKPMYDAYFKEFPELKAFHADARKVYERRGYVKSMVGRKCRLDDPRYSYRAVSRIIQSNNADILKWFLRAADMLCEAEGDDVNILMTVHDSIALQAPRTERCRKIADEVVSMFERVQEPPFNLRVPFVMETGRGNNWGEAKFGPAK